MSWGSGSWSAVGGGGGPGGDPSPSEPELVLVSDWSALSDTASRCSASSHTSGLVSFTMAGDGVAYDGFQEALPRRTSSLLTHVPDFDPQIHDLEVYVEVLQLPTAAGPAAYGLAAILADRATVASQAGIGVSARAASATTQSVQMMAATAGTGSAGAVFSPIAAFRMVVAFAQQANGNWLPGANVLAHDSLYDSLPVATYGTGTQMLPTVSDWQLQIAVNHVGTVSGTPTLRCRVYVRALRRASRYPTVAAAAKPASGTMIAAFVGDSTGGGFGTDQAPPNGQAGEALPAGVTLFVNGVSQPTWPDTPGNAPNPGYMATFAAAALADGFTAVELHCWYANGRELPTMMTNEYQDLRDYLATAGADPASLDVLVPCIGTNDGSASNDAATYASLISRAMDAMQLWFTNARILAVKPAVTTATYPNVATVNAALTSAVAARSATRALVDPPGAATSDTLHPTPAFYATVGTAIYTAWQGLP